MSDEMTEDRVELDAESADLATTPETDPVTDPETDSETDSETDLEEGSAESTPDPAAEPADESSETDSDAGQDEESSTDSPGTRVQRLEAEGEIAADYLEELLDIADLDGDLDMDVEGDRAAVSIVGADLSQLVGRDGDVLDALQELTRLAVYRETGERSRLMLDVSGFRAKRRETVEKLAAEKIAEVRETSSPVALEPMSSFERKVVHDAVAAAGLNSESEGAEPRRFVVIQAP